MTLHEHMKIYVMLVKKKIIIIIGFEFHVCFMLEVTRVNHRTITLSRIPRHGENRNYKLQ